MSRTRTEAACLKDAFATLPEENTMDILTAQERKTIEAFHALVKSRTPIGGSWQFGIQSYKNCSPSFDVVYFTSEIHTQISCPEGATFSDKMETCLRVQAKEDANPSKAVSDEVSRLRKRLAQLEERAA